jgi:hypothetical protein
MPPPPPDRTVQKLRHPQPRPPHLHHAAPCSAPGRPKHSTGSPPARVRARPLGAARPGPASASPAPPGPRSAPARPKWAVRSSGEGSEGRPRPRARIRASTPRHACPPGHTQELHGSAQDPSLQGLVTVYLGFNRFGTWRAGHLLLQPGPRGQQQLVIV